MIKELIILILLIILFVRSDFYKEHFKNIYFFELSLFKKIVFPIFIIILFTIWLTLIPFIELGDFLKYGLEQFSRSYEIGTVWKYYTNKNSYKDLDQRQSAHVLFILITSSKDFKGKIKKFIARRILTRCNWTVNKEKFKIIMDRGTVTLAELTEIMERKYDTKKT